MYTELPQSLILYNWLRTGPYPTLGWPLNCFPETTVPHTLLDACVLDRQGAALLTRLLVLVPSCLSPLRVAFGPLPILLRDALEEAVASLALQPLSLTSKLALSLAIVISLLLLGVLRLKILLLGPLAFPPLQRLRVTTMVQQTTQVIARITVKTKHEPTHPARTPKTCTSTTP